MFFKETKEAVGEKENHLQSEETTHFLERGVSRRELLKIGAKLGVVAGIAVAMPSLLDLQMASAAATALLPAPYVNQKTVQRTISTDGYWVYCGPSSAAVVLGLYNKTNNPTQEARNLTNEVLINRTPYKGGVRGGSTGWGLIGKALERRGIPNTREIGGKPSYEEIVAEIDAGRPLILGVGYGAGGHIIVVIGYDRVGQTLIVHDPYGKWEWWNHTGNSPWVNQVGQDNTVNKANTDRGYGWLF